MMRIIWGLRDTESDYLLCLFEAENLLVDYRDQLLRRVYDSWTADVPERDYLPGDEQLKKNDDFLRAERERLLDMGYDRWRAADINSTLPHYKTERYELWNSVPPNPERLVMHFDT